MKRGGVLHPELARQLALCGHRDEICVADAGLPIPAGACRVDLAYAPGRAPFFDVLDVLLGELAVEGALRAEEMDLRSPEAARRLDGMLGGIPVEKVPHEAFKEALARVRLVVRTGEHTPFANVILRCGVPF